MKTKSILSIVAVLLLLFLGGQYFYKNIYYPASLSYDAFCTSAGEELLVQEGYIVIGTYNSQEDKITILDNNTSTYKHEFCHKVQAEENRLTGCVSKKGYISNEMECYIAQRLPNVLYNLKY